MGYDTGMVSDHPTQVREGMGHKGTVSLYTNRLPLFRQVLEAFTEVNDPYISERLFAASYGCAVRSTNEGLQELAASRGLDLDIDMERIRPLYRSERPGKDSGTSGFEPLDLNGEIMTDEDRASWRLYHSVMGPWVFSRQIIPRGVEKISRIPLHQDQPALPAPQERHDSFIESLGPAEREAWERYIQTTDATSLLKQFLASIRESGGGEDIDGSGFDGSVARRWILSRVLELGWSAERFGSFDTWVGPYGYHSSHTSRPERMGKKY